MSEPTSAFASDRRVDLVRVLEEDPGLGEGLDTASLEQAARVIARVLELPAGQWDVPEPADPAGLLGLLVLDGLLVRSVVALLDRRFALGTARWPEIQAALLDRAVTRARRMAFNVSVCSLVRLDLRLLVALWHLADRWGRVTADGVLLPLRLSHELLAGVVGD